MVGRKTIAGGMAALIAATSLTNFPTFSFAGSVVSSVLSHCSFTLENASQPSEQVRAKCTALDSPDRHVTILFSRGAGYAYVRERAGQTLYCEVRMEKTAGQNTRLGVFECRETISPSSHSTAERSSNSSANIQGKLQ